MYMQLCVYPLKRGLINVNYIHTVVSVNVGPVQHDLARGLIGDSQFNRSSTKSHFLYYINFAND